MTSPLYVANTLIIRANERGTSMSHLKLQKLMYILYARYLAVTGEPLFADRFEAWKYGPVLSNIYRVFKDFGEKPITAPQKSEDGHIWSIEEEGEFGDVFNTVWNAFGQLFPVELVNKTHEAGSAWRYAMDEIGEGGFLDDEHIKQDGNNWFPGN